MNAHLVDVILLLLLAAYAISGFRQGLVVGALSLGGFLAFFFGALAVLPSLLSSMQTGVARSLLILAVAAVVAWLGQVLGALVGGRLRGLLRKVPGVRGLDAALGAVAAVLAVSLVAWFIGVAVRVTGPPVVARAVGGSTVLRVIDDLAPPSLTSVADSFVGDVVGSYVPPVFAGLGPERILSVGPPDPSVLSPGVQALARRSTVKVTGDAASCGRGQEGSGAVVARQRVLTNAHVVAGVSQPSVQLAGSSRRYPATVVIFDPARDLAVLDVPSLRAPVLATGAQLVRGDSAVVAGFPQNGPFLAVPARVRQVLTARGEDIYGHDAAERGVYSLNAQVRPGNSGGPLLDTHGHLVGLVFAKSLDSDTTGYALTLAEISSTVKAAAAHRSQVSSGACTDGG